MPATSGERLMLHQQTITDLRAEIHAVISEVRHETILNRLKNWVHRMVYCQVSRGAHLIKTEFLNKYHVLTIQINIRSSKNIEPLFYKSKTKSLFLNGPRRICNFLYIILNF